MIACHPGRPFNDLPALPPPVALDSSVILKAVVSSGRALAQLKGITHVLPNPTLLLNTVALQEAKASSEIENIFTTNDELYRGLNQAPNVRDPHAKEVLHYNAALWKGAERFKSRPVFSTNLFIELVQTITATESGIRNRPGTVIGNRASGQIVYTPPDGEGVIRDKLEELERFCNNTQDGIDPLIKMALMHYQFEAIHPFFDGNGRTGRILIILYLLMTDLLEVPILFISRYIIDNKARYYELLQSVTHANAWEDWILYMLRAIEQTAQGTYRSVTAIYALLEMSLQKARESLPTRTYSKELIELIFAHPYIRIKTLEKAGFGTRHTCSGYLQDLERAGLLESRKIGRDMVYINTELMQILTRLTHAPTSDG